MGLNIEANMYYYRFVWNFEDVSLRLMINRFNLIRLIKLDWLIRLISCNQCKNEIYTFISHCSIDSF